MAKRQYGASLAFQSQGSNWKRECCAAVRPETVFRVRQGPDYKRNGKKAPSGPEMFEQIGADVFKCPKKQVHLGAHIQLPPLPPGKDRPVGGVPPIFIVNYMLPNYEPPNPLWGTPITDGPGFSLVTYFQMKDTTRASLAGTGPSFPAIRLLQRFIAYEEERVRMKAIINVLNGPELNFSSALNSLINQYNMKPILTRPQHQFYTDYKTYFEVDIDIHVFGYVARRGLTMLMPLLSRVAADASLVVEGWEDDELPENILLHAHIHNCDFEHAEEINFPAVPNPHPPADVAAPPHPAELHPCPSPGPETMSLVFPGSEPGSPMLTGRKIAGIEDDWESSDDEALTAEQVEVYGAAIVALMLPEQ